MIYLICAQNNRQEIVELDEAKDYKDNSFYKYFYKNYIHKNILYPIEFYNDVTQCLLPRRVNVIFDHNYVKKVPNIPGAIVTNNIKDIIKAYKADIDDIYILASHRWIIEEFGNYADYLIIFASNNIGYGSQSLSDLINLGDFNLLRSQNFEKYHFEFYMSNKKNGK